MSDVQYERLTGDGDAGGLLQAKGQAFIALAETIRESVDCLSKIEDEDSTKSEAMTKLRDLARTVRQDIEKASGLYHIVGEQITGYRLALETAKAVADPAADEIDNLNGHLGARQTAATDASAAYITARNNLATAKLPWTQPPTGETKEQWITQLGNTASDRWSDKAAADSALSSLEDDIALQQRVWQNNNGWGGGKDYKDEMAAHHASKVDSAFEHKSVKGLEDSNWDKFKDWWDQVYKVLSIICDIAAILAIFLSWVPILGQVLAVLAAIGKIMLVLNALIQIVDSVGKAVDGKKGVLECLGDVVTNLVGALAGKVLGASGKIVSGLSKGKNFGQLMVKQFSAPLSPSVKNLAHFTKMNKSLKNASGFGKVPVVFKNMGQSFKLNSDLRFRHGSTGSGAGDGAMRFVFGSGAEYVSTMLKNGTMNRLGAIYSVASAGHASYQFINHTYNFGLAVHNGDAGGAFAHGSNAVGGSLPGSWGTVAGIPGKVHEHMS